MTLHERIEGDVLVVGIGGPHFDATSAPEVKRHLAKRISQGHQRLVLDLSEVDFIDSSGLSTLVFVLQRLGNHQAMAISSPRDTVMSMLKLTRLCYVFNIIPDCEQAIARLRATLEARAAANNSL